MKDFVKKAKNQEEERNSWLVDMEAIDKKTWDLTVSNPNFIEEVDNRSAEEIIAEIEALDTQAAQALQAIKELL